MNELSPHQKARYIESNGIHCPVCESDDIVIVSDEFTSYRAYRDNKCQNCGATFTETFTMSDVELTFTPPDAE